MAEFGRFFKAIRLKTGQSLRQFCLANGLDAGNTSKLERGKLPPPGRAVLDKYAQMLGLKEGSSDWFTFFDLAAAEAGRIPDDLMDDEELAGKLPLVFRTLRGERLTEEQLRDLAERIRRT